MSRGPQRPVVSERVRMGARVFVVAVAYGLYRFLAGEDFAGAVAVGGGALLVGWAIVDRVTLGVEWHVGALLFAVALAAVGTWLVVR